jgi:hypothetical protein
MNTYALEMNSFLIWLNLGSPLTAAGATFGATDSVTNGPQRFYRLALSR